MRPTGHSDLAASTTILVVDDFAEVRRFCHAILEEEGYRVCEACDGFEALEILQSSDPPIDLVLTDLIMPRLNGIALGERLATIRPHIPVLFMSGHIEASLSLNKIPGELLLRKPFAPARLVEIIATVLETDRP